VSDLAQKMAPAQRPPFRKLRAYAFDPSLSTQLETAVVNEVTLKVPWEEGDVGGTPCESNTDQGREPNPFQTGLGVGPVGEYLEVVDYDPASGCFYEPVDLNHPHLLAQDGLMPSQGNPQFHQQMVYAVAMTTIRNFERALGRRALWSTRFNPGQPRGKREEYVQHLRIYPHAMREANAYYSPAKKALLFGYFPASSIEPGKHYPGGIVFTCLSHDIIAHETTHALLDGMHRRFIEPSNPDVLAFHEAFADIVALFQHFSFPEVLRHQIAKTRGDLASQNLLGQLAQEFGGATGRYGALRDAIGTVNPDTKRWERSQPDATQIERTFEPHARGALLVAAVFDAFLSIYQSRVSDLVRLATSGSGVLPEGDIHPDLVNRLADEAAKSAQHILNMCIRALDYCPPVDLTFGEYLRALITADYDLVPDDRRGYRVAIVEAFRQRGIYPRDMRHLSPDSLRWQCPTDEDNRELCFRGAKELQHLSAVWNLTTDRAEIHRKMKLACVDLYHWIKKRRSQQTHVLMGLDLSPGGPPVEVHSARPTRRVGPEGQMLTLLVIEITQRRPGYFDKAQQQASDERDQLARSHQEEDSGNGLSWSSLSSQAEYESASDEAQAAMRGCALPEIEVDNPEPHDAENSLGKKSRTKHSERHSSAESQPSSQEEPDFWFRGGCTLLVDPETYQVRYCLQKDITSESRLHRQRAFLTGKTDASLQATYFGGLESSHHQEPFALMHRAGEEGEGYE
jgi:hypothetical protein